MEPKAYESLKAYRHSIEVLYIGVGCRENLNDHTVGTYRD